MARAKLTESQLKRCSLRIGIRVAAATTRAAASMAIFSDADGARSFVAEDRGIEFDT